MLSLLASILSWSESERELAGLQRLGTSGAGQTKKEKAATVIGGGVKSPLHGPGEAANREESEVRLINPPPVNFRMLTGRRMVAVLLQNVGRIPSQGSRSGRRGCIPYNRTTTETARFTARSSTFILIPRLVDPECKWERHRTHNRCAVSELFILAECVQRDGYNDEPSWWRISGAFGQRDGHTTIKAERVVRMICHFIEVVAWACLSLYSLSVSPLVCAWRWGPFRYYFPIQYM